MAELKELIAAPHPLRYLVALAKDRFKTLIHRMTRPYQSSMVSGVRNVSKESRRREDFAIRLEEQRFSLGEYVPALQRYIVTQVALQREQGLRAADFRFGTLATPSLGKTLLTACFQGVIQTDLEAKGEASIFSQLAAKIVQSIEHIKDDNFPSESLPLYFSRTTTAGVESFQEKKLTEVVNALLYFRRDIISSNRLAAKRPGQRPVITDDDYCLENPFSKYCCEEQAALKEHLGLQYVFDNLIQTLDQCLQRIPHQEVIRGNFIEDITRIFFLCIAREVKRQLHAKVEADTRFTTDEQRQKELIIYFGIVDALLQDKVTLPEQWVAIIDPSLTATYNAALEAANLKPCENVTFVRETESRTRKPTGRCTDPLEVVALRQEATRTFKQIYVPSGKPASEVVTAQAAKVYTPPCDKSIRSTLLKAIDRFPNHPSVSLLRFNTSFEHLAHDAEAAKRQFIQAVYAVMLNYTCDCNNEEEWQENPSRHFMRKREHRDYAFALMKYLIECSQNPRMTKKQVYAQVKNTQASFQKLSYKPEGLFCQSLNFLLYHLDCDHGCNHGNARARRATMVGTGTALNGDLQAPAATGEPVYDLKRFKGDTVARLSQNGLESMEISNFRQRCTRMNYQNPALEHWPESTREIARLKFEAIHTLLIDRENSWTREIRNIVDLIERDVNAIISSPGCKKELPGILLKYLHINLDTTFKEMRHIHQEFFRCLHYCYGVVINDDGRFCEPEHQVSAAVRLNGN